MQLQNGRAGPCFFCGNEVEVTRYNTEKHSSEGYRTDVKCKYCGFYRLGEFAKTTLDRDLTNEKRQALAWIVRDLSPAIKGSITHENLDDLVHQSLSREPTPSGKARLLLQELKRRSMAFGRPVDFDPSREWPVIKARGSEECKAIIEELRARGLLKHHLEDSSLVLDWNAWEMLEPLTGSAAKTVFVAMAFRPDLDDIYDAIKVAIERTGLTPIRIDKQTFSEKICDRILTEIHSAEFVVADFTYQRGGVYFEAGYALALQKPIIWLCQEDDSGNLHFDTRQYPHIMWTTPENLGTRLEQRLRYLVQAQSSSA